MTANVLFAGSPQNHKTINGPYLYTRENLIISLGTLELLSTFLTGISVSEARVVSKWESCRYWGKGDNF